MARINQTAEATFTDDPAGTLRYGIEIEPAWDENYLKNHIEINDLTSGVRGRTGSGIAIDDQSTLDYGIIVDSFDSALAGGGERQALAEYRLYLYSQPRLRLPSFEPYGVINPATAWPAIFGLEIGDAVDVVRFDNLTSEMTLNLNVEGMQLSKDPTGPLRVRIKTSPRDTRTYLVLDDATLGDLDSTNRLAP